MCDYLQIKWEVFAYNFKWADYIPLFDGWLPRCAIAVPVVGYLILFNDLMVSYLTFDEITSDSTEFFIFSSIERLRFVYFGLILLGVSNILYRWRRPWVHKIGKSYDEFTRLGLEIFLLSDYEDFHDKIQTIGHCTPQGDYNNRDWDNFLQVATGGANEIQVLTRADFTRAKQQYESVLKSILYETFFRESVKRRRSLSICIFLAVVGYMLLAAPSADLFQVILRSIM